MLKTYTPKLVAYLVWPVSVTNPVVDKWRIRIDSANEDFSLVWFTYKGRTLYYDNGVVCTPVGHRVANDVKIELTAKYLKERYVEGLCRMACDPSTETYWSM